MLVKTNISFRIIIRNLNMLSMPAKFIMIIDGMISVIHNRNHTGREEL